MAEGDEHTEELRRRDAARLDLTHDDRMRIHTDAAARFSLGSLAGRPISEAKSIVEAVGGIFVELNSGEPMTADFRTDRVLAETSNGHVDSAQIG